MTKRTQDNTANNGRVDATAVKKGSFTHVSLRGMYLRPPSNPNPAPAGSYPRSPLPVDRTEQRSRIQAAARSGS